MSEGNQPIFMKLYDLTDYLFSVKKFLRSAGNMTALFCVDVTPTHIFGIVQPEKVMCVQTQTHCLNTNIL